MAKKSTIENNKNRLALIKRLSAKRARLKRLIQDRSLSVEEHFQAGLRLARLPRNSSSVRFRNRCLLTGRARGFYRKFSLSRIALRELASVGLIPGMTKSSW